MECCYKNKKSKTGKFTKHIYWCDHEKTHKKL
jgi:hypothetical protein